ncbi:MAG TPA: DUF4249 domain-containing protein [Puia sp.]|jgi:hypothetical protein
MRPYALYYLAALMSLLLYPSMGCKQAFTPPALRTNPDLLVIDGVVNAGTGATTTFTLSRTQKIGDSLGAHTPEPGAQVTIKGSNGDSYTLQDQGNGNYQSTPLSLNLAEKYQVLITTRNGSKYQSDAVPVTTAPPIDSLGFKQDDSSGNVTISINTHDPAANSHYYRWFFTETWEYHAPLMSELALDSTGHIFYAIDSLSQAFLVYYCWRSDNSTDILLGNSTALGQDRISQAPLTVIPRASQKIQIRYSMLASQYVLTQPAYQYWLILQKNTQSLGTLFDPQPSQLIGNYHCLTNANEPVIGYLSVGTIRQLRTFISNSQVSNWDPGPYDCPTRTTDKGPTYDIYTYADTAWGPYYFSGNTLYLSRRTCVDCRAQGGTLQKPSFW